MNYEINILLKFLELLEVKRTKAFLKDSLLSHPDVSSLLAISDTLEKYNIETLAVNITNEKLHDIPLPCIVQVKEGNDTFFNVLTKVDSQHITIYNQKNTKVKISKELFFTNWTGICLLAEKTEKTKEPGIEDKQKRRKLINSLLTVLGSLFIIWLGFTVYSFWDPTNKINYFLYVGYTLLKIIGLTIGTFLLWYEVDKYNPALQNFCSGGKKVNCDQVLSSKYAYLLKNTLSVSALAFSYFFASVLLILYSNFSLSTITLLGSLSLAATPILLYSLYIQGVVVKSWCKFCLILAAVLTIEIVIVLSINSFSLQEIALKDIVLFALLFLTPILFWIVLKPNLEKGKETNLVKRSLQKIKFNKTVFETLLSKSDKVSTDFKDIGILLKNKNPKYHVIKVCNPYCGPCANAHPILDKLYHQGVIDLQIVFTASADESDMKYAPVNHLLAIDSVDSLNTPNALDDWYMAEKKDYEIFANKYPMNGELKEQKEKISKMKQWCNAEKITHTPTIYINGYKLTNEYAFEDLVELLQ